MIQPKNKMFSNFKINLLNDVQHQFEKQASMDGRVHAQLVPPEDYVSPIGEALNRKEISPKKEEKVPASLQKAHMLLELQHVAESENNVGERKVNGFSD